jgi:hypothetical protein
MNHCSGHLYSASRSIAVAEKAMEVVIPNGFFCFVGSTMLVRGTRMGWSEDMVITDSWFDKESLTGLHSKTLMSADLPRLFELPVTNSFLCGSSGADMEKMLFRS